MVIDADYHRDLLDGTVSPPDMRLVWLDNGDMMEANHNAHTMAGMFSKGWRARYPTESPLWVVRVRGGYAIVPNSLYSPNMAWRDAQEWASNIANRGK